MLLTYIVFKLHRYRYICTSEANKQYLPKAVRWEEYTGEFHQARRRALCLEPSLELSSYWAVVEFILVLLTDLGLGRVTTSTVGPVKPTLQADYIPMVTVIRGYTNTVHTPALD